MYLWLAITDTLRLSAVGVNSMYPASRGINFFSPTRFSVFVKLFESLVFT